jgi:hypothetical protein
LHELCLSSALLEEEKMSVFADLRRHTFNPLTLNWNNKRAVHLCREPLLQEVLSCYEGWRPKRRVTEWWGPHFRARVFALLLSITRLNHVAFCKDIRCKIVFFVACQEQAFVKSLPQF